MNKLVATAVIAAGIAFTVAGCHTPPPPQENSQVKPLQSPSKPAQDPHGVKSRKQSIEFQKAKEIIIE